MIGYYFAGFGATLFLVGCYLAGDRHLSSPSLGWLALALAVAVGSGLVYARSLARASARRVRLWRAQKRVSALAASLTPHLLGSYSPYLIEAAQRLGEARDVSAVPALVHVLENTVEQQQPGWQEVAESLVQCLARIGDARALPLLYRLAGIRGIGILPAIRDAIDVVEPQSSLLRPGQRETPSADVLLRPSLAVGETGPELLLRAAD